jgi:hypothetical protein
VPNLPKFQDWPPGANQLEPGDLARMYAQGFAGAVRDPAAERALDAALHWANFGQAAAEFGLAGAGDGQLSTPYQSVLRFSREAYRTAQRRGDCVSFGTRNAVDLTRAVEIDLKGEPESWENDSATEPIYWYRGHNGEGASCARLAEWVSTAGGLLLRQPYPDLGLDFSTYDASLGRNGSSGPPAAVVAEAKKHAVQAVTRITSVEQARDALANGYGVNCCSSYGFAKTRDEHGVARRSGSWAHSMAWTGCDARVETIERFGGMLFLVQNSWGYGWIGGPRRHDQPEGSFWIVEKDARGMISAGGTFAFSNVNGWPARKLPDYGNASFW